MKNRAVVGIQINPSNAKSNHLKSFKINLIKRHHIVFISVWVNGLFTVWINVKLLFSLWRFCHLRWNQGSVFNDPCSWVPFSLLFQPWEILFCHKSQYEPFVCRRSACTRLGTFCSLAADFKARPLTWVLFAAAVVMKSIFIEGFQTLAGYLPVQDHAVHPISKNTGSINPISWNDSKLWHFY